MKRLTCIDKYGKKVINTLFNHTVEGCMDIDVNLGTYKSVPIFTGNIEQCELFIKNLANSEFDFVEIQRNYTNGQYSTIKRYYK